MHILLVDDNPLMQRVITLLLESYGHQVQTATSAAEALSLCQRHAFGLVVLDLWLPDGDGPGVLASLRQLPGYASCPAIGISGMSDTHLDPALIAPFDAFLAKPLEIDTLVATVDRVTKPR
ncbi:response regulator [Candidatus Gracilibacteria bacterium]|nr:response regulator [Candidatus Gracilibacteria bacterium]